MVDNPKKILIVRTDRLGDVILSTPVIKNLREFFPEAFIGFMCRPYTKDVLEENPYLDKVIIYDKCNKHKSVWATIKFAFCLRKQKFDWAIILHPTNRVHLLTFLAGIPVRVGWNKKCGFLLTKKLIHKKQEGKKHELEYNLDILKSLNVSTQCRQTYFPVTKAADERAKSVLEDRGVSFNQKFIVVHPSASCPSKRWPSEYFVELVKLLKEKIDSKIIVVTAKGQEEFGESLIQQSDVVDLRGALSVLELGALLKRAKLFISNDSGPVHIAASFNTPVISIFGRFDPGLSPQRWRPLGRNSTYLHKDVGCDVCLAHDCRKEFLCLKNITPAELAARAILLFKN